MLVEKICATYSKHHFIRTKDLFDIYTILSCVELSYRKIYECLRNAEFNPLIKYSSSELGETDSGITHSDLETAMFITPSEKSTTKSSAIKDEFKEDYSYSPFDADALQKFQYACTKLKICKPNSTDNILRI